MGNRARAAQKDLRCSQQHPTEDKSGSLHPSFLLPKIVQKQSLLHSCSLQALLDPQRHIDNPTSEVVSQDLFCCCGHPQHSFSKTHQVQVPLHWKGLVLHQQPRAPIFLELQSPLQHGSWADGAHSAVEQGQCVLTEGHGAQAGRAEPLCLLGWPCALSATTGKASRAETASSLQPARESEHFY